VPDSARRLFLLRHAKSAWPEGVADHDRPLADRGRRDAVAVGRWLAANGVGPDLAIVSTAQRARETWEAVAAQLGSTREVRVTDEVYDAGAGDLLDVLRDVPEESPRVLVVGHNPGMERLAGLLDDGKGASEDRARMRSKFPTSGLAMLDVPRPWAAMEPETCRLTAFVVPRG
jgi:phosphohistidine phosphatase